LTALNQDVLQGIKKSYEELIWIQKSIEFQLPHYEIMQLLSHYYTIYGWYLINISLEESIDMFRSPHQNGARAENFAKLSYQG